MKYSNYSAVIIGSGIAGLYLAYRLSLSKKFKDGILLVTKKDIGTSNSRYAQGGIVGIMSENTKDSVALHIKDTLNAGSGLNDFQVVGYISENSEEVIKNLIDIGVKFDRDDKNKLKMTLEGAHSVPRILHAGGDATGRIIDETLIELVKKSKNIIVYENSMALELLLDKNKNCKGVVLYQEETDEYEAVYSGATILATGGAGQVFKYTTNPQTATGDGIVLAHNAGAEIRDMEFVQFHPTALNIKADRMPLISESVRGEGAILVDSEGIDFMPDYDARASLAPRDIVTRAIYSHLKKYPNRKIFLDISNIDLKKFETRFPTITEICNKNGVDLNKKLIPVTPSAHYLMGGIKASVQGETNICNLYAIGECSSTGLHGANRLASNSLLECVVCAYELAYLLEEKPLESVKLLDDSMKETLNKYDEQIELPENNCVKLKEDIKSIMWNMVGIERQEEEILNAIFKLNKIKELFEGSKCINSEHYETKIMVQTALIIAESAYNRKDGIGAHYIKTLEPKITQKTERELKQDGIYIK